MKVHVTDYTLYRRRYQIGYLCAALLVIGVLIIAAVYVPGGLRSGEMDSALVSGSLSMKSIDPTSVVNLPYHLLQRLSFLAFGVTTLSIKLPSILLAAGTIFGVFLLIKLWFRRNVAVIMAVIAATSTQFLFLAQDGTPGIMFSFVAIWLLAACTYMTRVKYFTTLWKVAACVLTATALYIPLGIYIVIAILVTATFHPHIRYMLRRIAKVRLTIAILLGAVALIPLVMAIYMNHSIAWMLLGLPSTALSIPDNIIIIGHQLFGFFVPAEGFLLRPLYPIGVIILMGVGTYRFLTIKYTARSYALFILSAFIFPIVILNPDHITSLYPLAILVIAMGISELISNWYRLFPRNPYARIVGLAPITVFVVGMVFTGTISYMNNYSYNPELLRAYNNDLRLLDRSLDASGASVKVPARVVAVESQSSFYSLVAHYDKRFSVTKAFEPASPISIMTRGAYHDTTPSEPIDTIVTSRKASQADRFYIYKSSTK